MTSDTDTSDREVLAVAGLRRSFGGIPAVDGVDVSVHAGEIVGLIGPNGSGKTTTISLIAGSVRPDGGSIRLAGQLVTGKRPDQIARRGLVRTFQIPRVWGQLTSLENLLIAGTGHADETLGRALFGRSHFRRRQREAATRAFDILNYLGVGHLADTTGASLSGGQKRLLEFGRLMMTDPKIVLLDEPFAGVNPTTIQQIQRVILRLSDDGAAVLLVEHNLAAVAETTSRVAVLALGKVIAEGDLATVRKVPEVIDAYLGEKVARP